MLDPNDPYGPHRRSPFQNAGFRVGLVAGLIVIVVHIVLLAINRWENRGDLVAWLFELVVYFLASQTAAEQHYNTQRDTPDHLRGVQGAGVGAALVTSVIGWVYIIMRGVFRDAFGITVIVEPVSLCFFIFLDGLLAIGLGSLGGGLVARKKRGFTNF